MTLKLRLLDPRRAPAAFMLHLSLAVIAAGALLTHFIGVEGKLHLRCGEAPASAFEQVSGPGEGRLPFGLELVEPVISYYPGTDTPMDFASLLRVTSLDGQAVLAESRTAVNKVMDYDGWRFFQSGISADSSTLVVSHDPVGTAVTYAGYLMAVMAMILFLFQKRTFWRASLRGLVAPVLLSGCVMAAQGSAPSTVQRPLAADLGKMYILWNGRVCPLQTMARDVTVRLYGSGSPHGYTPEQVIAGWLFYYDDWMDDLRAITSDEERLNLARWVGSGSALTIYPYLTAGGVVKWLSLSERRPSMMSLEQWVFIQEAMPRIASLIRRGRNVEAVSYTHLTLPTKLEV